MRKDAGFTIVEMMISAAILAFIISASASVLVTYSQREKTSERSIQIKKILLALSSDIANVRSSLPYFQSGSADGVYVLCYSADGVQQRYSTTEVVHLTTTSAVSATALGCQSQIEIRVVTSMSVTDATWTVTGLQRDPASGSLVSYPPFTLSRRLGM